MVEFLLFAKHLISTKNTSIKKQLVDIFTKGLMGKFSDLLWANKKMMCIYDPS